MFFMLSPSGVGPYFPSPTTIGLQCDNSSAFRNLYCRFHGNLIRAAPAGTSRRLAGSHGYARAAYVGKNAVGIRLTAVRLFSQQSKAYPRVHVQFHTNRQKQEGEAGILNPQTIENVKSPRRKQARRALNFPKEIYLGTNISITLL